MLKAVAWIIGAAIATACRESSTPASSDVLSCHPQVLTSGDTLTLRLGSDHPAELGIRGPDGTWFFLVYERSDAMAPGLRPLMDKKSFRNARTLALPVATARGSAWVAGRDQNEPIFRVVGEYEIVLTDVLESDAGFSTFRCKVRFKR
jgi:hypothetical protein